MAASSLISEDLTCAVCLDLYTKPRVLRCMHTYCHDCMASLVQKNRQTSFISCPECRQNTNLDSRDVAGLPVNLVLSKVVETYRSTPQQDPRPSDVPCSLCEDPTKFAVKTCVDCPRISYCDGCLSLFHPARGVLKTHKLVEPSATGNTSNNSASTSGGNTVNNSTSTSGGNTSNNSTSTSGGNTPVSSTLRVPSIEWLSSKPTARRAAIAFVTVSPCAKALNYFARCENANPPDAGGEQVLTTRWPASSNHVQLEGLMFETRYFVSVAAEYKNGTSAYSEQKKLYTAPRITCDTFLLRADDKHEDLELSEDCSTIAHVDNECLTVGYCFEQREWNRNCGITANYYFNQGCVYWEVELHYKVMGHIDNKIFACFGICEHDRFVDKYPLTRNFCCVCAVIFKVPDSSQVAVRIWNGPRKENLPSTVLGPLNRKPAHFRFGFFLNMNERVLKVIWQDEGTVLEMVQDLKIDHALPIFSVGDSNVIEVRLKSITGPEVEVPSIVED